ncbi:MAG TPA: hypothetical protein VFS51_08815 [Gemmatimonadales bacterium]|nr:hypothetical protein [Gemmatimonadales bacterium]
MRPREARLREAYKEWYPKITPGVWHNAAWLTEKVLQQQRSGSPVWVLEGRPLAEEHFEFQGQGGKEGGPKKRRLVGSGFSLTMPPSQE